jgi:DNA-binding transcriptional ArsR family regulator
MVIEAHRRPSTYFGEERDPMTAAPADLLAFFKALADHNRLRIVGLLASSPSSVDQLAAALGVGSPTVSHHLRRLAEVGLVHARAEGPYSVYALDAEPLHDLARRLLGDEALPDLAADADLDAFDRKVLATFVGPDGRFTAFPTQVKKSLVLVRHALQAFEPGARYTEQQVNERLRRFSDDTARLRRAFVDHGFMERTADGSAYWRVDVA